MSKDKITIVLLGANFSTGNLGVSALAWSTIFLIKQKWPEANIEVLGSGRQHSRVSVELENEMTEIENWPIRFSPNVLKKDHILLMITTSRLSSFIPAIAERLKKTNSTLGILLRADAFLDITGGDSFSDIYGITRFLRGYLLKRTCQMRKKPYIMLPQTYGPFRRELTKRMAKTIIKKSTILFTRDYESSEYIREIEPNLTKERYAVLPDVAFTLKSRKIENNLVKEITLWKTKKLWVGINISGLLYNNGYTRRNEFGLISNYRDVIRDIITWFVSKKDAMIIIVPHVIPPDGKNIVENDLLASKEIIKTLDAPIEKDVRVAEEKYDQCTVKYLIGKCDFFIGSRMHSTIASLSQLIPTVGLAYSKKFYGVYRTIGMEDCVLDLRSMNDHEVVERTRSLFEMRKELRRRLEAEIPIAQRKVMNLLGRVEI